MKKRAIIIPFLLLMPSLTSCWAFQDDGSWKEEYGNPALFLDNVSEPHYVYRYDAGGHNQAYQDRDLVLANAIKAAAPFTEIPERKPTTERFFTYEAYWQAATSGPNYCYLLTYDDGLMIIHHKNSLGPHGYLYFSIDEAKATALNDLAFSFVYGEDSGAN